MEEEHARFVLVKTFSELNGHHSKCRGGHHHMSTVFLWVFHQALPLLVGSEWSRVLTNVRPSCFAIAASYPSLFCASQSMLSFFSFTLELLALHFWGKKFPPCTLEDNHASVDGGWCCSCCLLHLNVEIDILAKRGDRFPYQYIGRDSNELLLAVSKHVVDHCVRIVAGHGFSDVRLPRRVLVVQVDKRSLISNNASVPWIQN